MHWFTAFVVFVMVWWTVLFAVLPVGVRPVDDAAATPGGWRGAPARTRLAVRLLATTLISVVLWLGVMAVIRSGWLSFRDTGGVLGY